GVVLLLLLLVLAGEAGGDVGLHFIERARVGGLLFFGLDDVVAELGAHEAGDLSGLLLKSHFVERRNGGAVLDPAEFASLRLAAGIVGVLLGELGEVGA